MFTLVIFIISLTLIVFLVLVKNVEISRGHNFPLTNFFSKSDQWILDFFFKVKAWLRKVNFKNMKLIFSRIMVSIRKVAMSFKRRFDHKQSYFFTKRDHGASKNKGSVSFFLKDISEHKKALRESKEE